MSHLAAARHWSRYAGVRTVAQVTAGWAAHQLAGRGQQMYVHPSLDDMLRACGGRFAGSAEELLAKLGWQEPLEEVREEYAQASRLLSRRYAMHPELPYPRRYAVEEQTGWFLYALVRLARPSVVVETGVANGHSSWLLLAALRANGSGELHSLDVTADVGALVDDHDRWHLQIAAVEDAPRQLRRTLHALSGEVDVFVHDSDHRYLNQIVEYRAAWPAMRPGGVFASDDVDDSRAFLDFAAAIAAEPHLMFDGVKVFGAVRV
jgi:predicted O-methyltransferase YrrM